MQICHWAEQCFTLVIPALGRCYQEVQESKPSFCYLANLRPAWASWDHPLNHHLQKEERKLRLGLDSWNARQWGKLRSRTMRALDSLETTACKCHQNRGVNEAKGSAKTGEVTFKESPGWQACTKQGNLYSLQYLNIFFNFQLTILSISLKVMETLTASWSAEWNKGWSKKDPKASERLIYIVSLRPVRGT